MPRTPRLYRSWCWPSWRMWALSTSLQIFLNYHLLSSEHLVIRQQWPNTCCWLSQVWWGGTASAAPEEICSLFFFSFFFNPVVGQTRGTFGYFYSGAEKLHMMSGESISLGWHQLFGEKTVLAENLHSVAMYFTCHLPTVFLLAWPICLKAVSAICSFLTKAISAKITLLPGLGRRGGWHHHPERVLLQSTLCGILPGMWLQGPSQLWGRTRVRLDAGSGASTWCVSWKRLGGGWRGKCRSLVSSWNGVISVYVGISGILKAKHFRLCRQFSATTSWIHSSANQYSAVF